MSLAPNLSTPAPQGTLRRSKRPTEQGIYSDSDSNNNNLTPSKKRTKTPSKVTLRKNKTSTIVKIKDYSYKISDT